MQSITRYSGNPILKPGDVMPSDSNMKVEGIFNCGAVKFGDEYVLLCRVAESIIGGGENLLIPVLSADSGYREVVVESYRRDSPLYDFSDSRVIRRRGEHKILRLTTLSHFRLARSSDGHHFSLDSVPCIFPEGYGEEWGIEDPRITEIEGIFYVTYSSISSNGVTVSLISTTDFRAYSRHGVILPPTNKDAALFPAKIGGKYWILHRPVPSDIGELNIWIAHSETLADWGGHRMIYSPNKSDEWESSRVGVGPPPVLTERGWLVMYHGVNKKSVYSAGLLLLDRDDPSKVLAKAKRPFFSPEASYEKEGFFPDVVFPCGLIPTGAGLLIYYGAADKTTCLAETSWNNIWRAFDE